MLAAPVVGKTCSVLVPSAPASKAKQRPTEPVDSHHDHSDRCGSGVVFGGGGYDQEAWVSMDREVGSAKTSSAVPDPGRCR
jgi:hypothetical protein